MNRRLEYTVNGHLVKVSIRPYSKSDRMLIMDYYRLDKTRVRRRLGTEDMTVAVAATNIVMASSATAEGFLSEDTDGHSNQDPLLKDIIDYYIEIQMVVSGRKERSIRQYAEILWDFKRFASNGSVGRVSQLSRKTIDAYALSLVQAGQAPRTIRRKLGNIRSCLNAAIDAGMIKESPIKKWLMPKIAEVEITPLEPAQLGKLLNAVEAHQPCSLNIIRWIANTGNRPSDAIGLKWRNVDMEKRTVERLQPKVKRLARYQVGDAAYASLLSEKGRARPGSGGEVFTRRDGTIFSQPTLLRALRNAIKLSGFERDVTIKDLRHTFAHVMANHCGCQLPVLQILMGHSDIDMTMRYVRGVDAFPALEKFAELTTEHPPIAGHQ